MSNFIRGRLTGRISWRINWRGRAILQVEYLWAGMAAYSRQVCENNVGWRDADALDLSSAALRWLVDGPVQAICPSAHGAMPSAEKVSQP